MILVYLAVALATVAGVAVWVEFDTYDRARKADFVADCRRATQRIGDPISRRYCTCIWDELRDHYSSPEIADSLAGWDLDGQFDQRLMNAIEDCQ